MSTQRVAVVAGCEGQIALAVVRRFVRRGDKVVVCGPDLGPAVQEAVRGKPAAAGGAGSVSYVADCHPDHLVELVLDRHGQIDVLVNGSPPVAADKPVGDTIDALRNRMMTVARHMRSGGQIVNMMSSAGRYRTGYFESGADAGRSLASKAAVDGAIFAMTRQVGFELARHGVRVNAVSLGWIRSDERERDWGAMTTQERDFLFEEISLGRLGEPDEVAAAVEFLASEASSYVTCNAIDVNGGWWTS